MTGRDYVWVDGYKYKLIERDKFNYVKVQTKHSIKKARPCYIGWTFTGYTFCEKEKP